SATPARAGRRFLEGGTNRRGRVLVTRPALALHFGQYLGLLTVRDGRLLVGDGDAHLPEQRDQRVGFDPEVFRQFDNLHATALPPLRRSRPSRPDHRALRAGGRPARHALPRSRPTARTRLRPPTCFDPPG